MLLSKINTQLKSKFTDLAEILEVFDLIMCENNREVLLKLKKERDKEMKIEEIKRKDKFKLETEARKNYQPPPMREIKNCFICKKKVDTVLYKNKRLCADCVESEILKNQNKLKSTEIKNDMCGFSEKKLENYDEETIRKGKELYKRLLESSN